MVQLSLHAVVQIASVGQGHLIAVPLPVKHHDEPLALLAGLLLAGLDHAIAFGHLVVHLTRFQQIIHEMVEGIPSSVPLHASPVPSPHLGQHVEDQAQGQSRHDVFPVAQLVLGHR